MSEPIRPGASILRAMQEGSTIGLHAFAEAVLELAAEKAPPTDPENDPNPNVTLKESGSIVPDPEGHGHLLVVFDTPYAAKLHENLRYKHPHGGGPKFLEHAVQELAPQFEEFVTSAIHGRFATKGHF